MKILVENEKPVFELPLAKKCNKRYKLIKMFSALIWRKGHLEQIEQTLNDFYEKAYSNGIVDANKFRDKIDKL